MEQAEHGMIESRSLNMATTILKNNVNLAECRIDKWWMNHMSCHCWNASFSVVGCDVCAVDSSKSLAKLILDTGTFSYHYFLSSFWVGFIDSRTFCLPPLESLHSGLSSEKKLLSYDKDSTMKSRFISAISKLMGQTVWYLHWMKFSVVISSSCL